MTHFPRSSRNCKNIRKPHNPISSPWNNPYFSKLSQGTPFYPKRAAQKVKGRMFDFEKLKGFLNSKYNAKDLQMFYYTAYPADGTREYSLDGRHKFYTYLKKGLGFIVRKKELKRIAIHTDAEDSLEEKGNMDVEMTIDALHHMSKYDIAILFSGDSDFLALINYLKRGGKKVYVYSSKNNVSEELRTGGDGYTDVLTIIEDIWGRGLKHREQK